MLHVHYFITRKSSMSDADFHRYWRETHGPIAAKIPQPHRYVQSHRIAAFGANSPYDGAAEVLIDSLEAMAALRRSSEYLDGALADERNFIDLSRVEWMVTRDHVVLDGPTGGNLLKGVWQLVIKPGMTVEKFREYWLKVHGPMALKLPGLRRYVQSHLIDEAYLYGTPRFDGVAQLWFDSPAAFAEAFASPAGRELMADGAVFIDAPKMTFFMAQEHIQIASR
ncbi:MAG TPA: EthD family reductase [Candidatus Binataceae bacterium]